MAPELGFSRRDRENNVRAIGVLAAAAMRRGELAICAAIAPYASARHAARVEAEAVGHFVLVHVATPLAVCEARDAKGLYARARAGLVEAFTGISGPYEPPADADLVVDTTQSAPAECANRIWHALEAAWYEPMYNSLR